MYILIVARGYPSFRYKLNGLFEYDQARALARAGHKVVYAAVDLRSIRHPRKWGRESFSKDGVCVEAMNLPAGRIAPHFLHEINKKALLRLYRGIEKKFGRPDVVHAHFIRMSYAALELCEKENLPLVGTEHFSAFNQEDISARIRNWGRYTYPRLDRVIAVSSHLATSLQEKFLIDPLVIPNVVDTEVFSLDKEGDRNEEEGTFTFISTGRLSEEKRMDWLILAFHEAFDEKEQMRLVIFGDGPQKERLKKKIVDLGEKDRIFLRGVAERQEIAEKMKKSQAFVLASRGETFGLAYIEALAAGLPVIASRCGGPEDFIHEQNGIILKEDTPRALKEALFDMANNIGRYDREAISREVSDKFSSGAIAAQLGEVYAQVVAEHKVQKASY